MPVLIDGDILVYRCAAALRHNRYDVYTPDGHFILSATKKLELNRILKDMEVKEDEVVIKTHEWYDPVQFGYSNIKSMINSICDRTMYPDHIICVSGDTNFRYGIATVAPYKADRPERPKFYTEVKKFLWSRPNVLVSEGCEADDLLGMGATQYHGDFCIASLDKDLDMVPGDHYDFANGILYHVDERQAVRNFYRQLVTGDRVDNIHGVEGIGPVKAKRIIDDGITDVYEMFLRVFREYIRMYQRGSSDVEQVKELAWSHVVENGKLLWIWRMPNDIWEPPMEYHDAVKLVENYK